jgi:hypothetical protein
MWALHLGARIVFMGETIFDWDVVAYSAAPCRYRIERPENAFTTTLSQIRAYAAAGRARRLPIELPGYSGSCDRRRYER